MEEYVIQHHGILGQKWGVRRFQNPDGTLTPAGRQRLNTVKDKTLRKVEWRKQYHNSRAEHDKASLKDLKKNGINSEIAKENWEMLSEEQKWDLAKRGGYEYSLGQMMDVIFPFTGLAAQNEYGMRQMVKEDISELEESHKYHIEKAKKYTQRYEDLKMSDIDTLASKYGYKEAKRQLSSKKD